MSGTMVADSMGRRTMEAADQGISCFFNLTEKGCAFCSAEIGAVFAEYGFEGSFSFCSPSHA